MTPHEHLINHEKLIAKEMKVIQDFICNSENLATKVLIENKDKYVKLQDTLHFVSAMKNALFPPKIVQPQNGMKMIN